MSPQTLQKIEAAVGPRGYLTASSDLKLYEYDGGVDKAKPDVVAFPRNTAQVVALVKIANEANLPLVGRGAGPLLDGPFGVTSVCFAGMDIERRLNDAVRHP